MLVFLLVLLFIIVSSSVFTGSSENFIITYKNPGEEEIDEFIYREFIFYKLIQNFNNIINLKYTGKFFKKDLKVTDVFILKSLNSLLTSYFYSYNGTPTFTFDSFPETTIELMGIKNIKSLCKEFVELKKKYPRRKLTLRKGDDKNAIWQLLINDFKNRPEYEISLIEKQRITCFNRVIGFLAPGNQWSLFSDADINELKKENFIIECFGSAFNSRLKYFGSLNEVDEPLGRLGTYSEILDNIINNTLYYRNKKIPNNDLKITVDPPSTATIVYDSYHKIVEVLKSYSKNGINYGKKIEIIYHVPVVRFLQESSVLKGYADVLTKINNKILFYRELFEEAMQWKKSWRVFDKAYTHRKEVKSLIGMEWIEIRYAI